MGGEGEAAWRALLDDLVRRGLQTPELVVVDGAPGLEKALAALWPDVAVQRCTVPKHRNLLAHAPERLHEEISNDCRDMIYAATRGEVETWRKAFIRKWRLKCRAVADILGASEKLSRYDTRRTMKSPDLNPIEDCRDFKRRIKLRRARCAETAAVRTVVGLPANPGGRCGQRALFKPAECENYFEACGYDPGELQALNTT